MEDDLEPAPPTGRQAAARSRSTRPTIFDVARVSGVSYSTVSRVVNGQPHIREATRLRVQAAMRELGYVAHVSARTLASGRSRMIGLLATEVESPFFSGVIGGVDHEVAAIDYDFLLCTTHDRRQKEAEYVARLSHGMVDGLLVMLPRGLPDYMEQLRQDRFPFVLIDYEDEARGCDVVNASNRAGASEAFRHLLGLGHRRIGFITGNMVTGSARERVLAFRDVMTGAGLPMDPALMVEGDFLEPRGHAAGHELLALPEPPTAIFASSDAAAFGVLRAARERDLSVPGNLSVLGFDDIPEASWLSPGLTTVRQPLRDMGRTAVRQLHRRMTDGDTPAARIVLDTTLMVRGTTGPVPVADAERRVTVSAGRKPVAARDAG